MLAAVQGFQASNISAWMVGIDGINSVEYEDIQERKAPAGLQISLLTSKYAS